MNKDRFKILINAIDNTIFEVVLSGELKGRAIERSLQAKDEIEKEAYLALQEKAQKKIYERKSYITNFINNMKGDNEQ